MQMIRDNLWRAWAWLLAFSLVSTFAAQWLETYAPMVGILILALAYLKMRLILSRYLGLAATPYWNAGFGLVLGLYMLGLLGLYLMPFA